MIEEIKKTYGEFCDSWVSEITIGANDIQLIIICANKLKNYTYEVIQLSFDEILFYKIDKEHYIDNYVVKNALIEENDKFITVDLDPIDYFYSLKENTQSIFKIKCKNISFKFIEKYKN